MLRHSCCCYCVVMKDWLSVDCPHSRLLSVEYETKLSDWAPQCPYELQRYCTTVVVYCILPSAEMFWCGTFYILLVAHYCTTDIHNLLVTCRPVCIWGVYIGCRTVRAMGDEIDKHWKQYVCTMMIKHWLNDDDVDTDESWRYGVGK